MYDAQILPVALTFPGTWVFHWGVDIAFCFFLSFFAPFFAPFFYIVVIYNETIQVEPKRNGSAISSLSMLIGYGNNRGMYPQCRYIGVAPYIQGYVEYGWDTLDVGCHLSLVSCIGKIKIGRRIEEKSPDTRDGSTVIFIATKIIIVDHSRQISIPVINHQPPPPLTPPPTHSKRSNS